MWASLSAEATSASGVGPPYLAYSSLSSDPALTPMRRLTPASVAALQMSGPTWSNLRMLPGFTRTAAQPASMAWNTYFDWKWMSAMIGIGDLATICGKASASSWLGTATRTMSQPAAVSSAICCSVAGTFAVSVLVIDCTEMGAPPPTGTGPTMMRCDLRRGCNGLSLISGSPVLRNDPVTADAVPVVADVCALVCGNALMLMIGLSCSIMRDTTSMPGHD